MVIEMFRFCPSESRSEDKVIGLSCKYNEDFRVALKEILYNYRELARDEERGVSIAGNWHRERGVWYVEESVFPLVMMELRYKFPDMKVRSVKEPQSRLTLGAYRMIS